MQLRLNPKLEIQAVRVSDEHLCVVIDDFLQNPGDAVEFACARADRFEQQERAYPGLVLPVANDPLAEMNRFIQVEMSRDLYLRPPYFERETMAIDPSRIRELNTKFEQVLQLFFDSV